MNETPAFHLDAYSTLHRKTLTHSLPFAWCLISFMTFFNTTALTEIFKRESCVSYLGRGFLKFFSLSVCFLTFRLSPWLSNLRLLVVEETSLVFDTRPHLISLSPTWRYFPSRRVQIWFGALLVTAVLTLFDALLINAIYSQAFLAQKSYSRLVFCGFQSRFREKMKIFFCQIPRRHCCGEHFFPEFSYIL